VFRQRGHVVGIGVHIVAIPRLTGPSVAAAVVSDAPKAAGREEEHLVLKGIRAQGPAMAENHGLAHSPVLVVDLRSVFGNDRRHATSKCRFGLPTRDTAERPKDAKIWRSGSFAIEITNVYQRLGRDGAHLPVRPDPPDRPGAHEWTISTTSTTSRRSCDAAPNGIVHAVSNSDAGGLNARQFAAGRSTRSITNTSTGPFAD